MYRCFSPAYAVQALLTNLVGQYLYQAPGAPRNVSASADIVFFVEASIPTSQRGYVAVMIVLLVHTLLVAVITASFISSTKATVLDDSWGSTAQLWTDDVQDVMGKAASHSG